MRRNGHADVGETARDGYLIAGVKAIGGIQLALGLAAAIWERGRSDERLMMKFEFRSGLHRVAVGFPLAGEMRSASVPELEIRVALRRAGKALVNMTVVRRLKKCGKSEKKNGLIECAMARWKGDIQGRSKGGLLKNEEPASLLPRSRVINAAAG